MKKNFLLVICSILSFFITSAQDTIYQVHFNDNYFIIPRNFQKNNENNFYSITQAVITTTHPNCCGGVSIIKFDSLGLLIWQKKYYQPFNATFVENTMELDTTQFLVISTGHTVPQDTSFHFFFTIDINGNPLNAWRYIGDYKLPFALSITRLSNEYYVSGFGYRYPQNFVQRDLLIYKTDSLFQPLWAYSYENSGTGYWVLEMRSSMNGDGIVVAGEYIDTLNGPNYGVLIKIDTAGNILWSYRYEGGALTGFDDIIALPDGGFVLTGYTTEPTKYSGLLAKVDSLGNVVWSHEYSMNGFCKTVSLTNDGGYIVSGSAHLWGDRTFLLKTDSIGNPEWMHFNTLCDDPVGAEQTADGGYIYAASGGGTTPNMSVGKTDSLGNMGCDDLPFAVTSHPTLVRFPLSFTRIPWQITKIAGAIQVDSTQFEDSLLCAGYSGIATHDKPNKIIEIFPNPAYSVCTISAPLYTNSTLSLYDITGREILQQQFNEKEEISINSLVAGVYIIYLKNKDGKNVIGKLIKN